MNHKDLLDNPKVIEEIEKHRWIESEKASHDVGYEWASEDWLARYAQSWMEFNLPKPTPKTQFKQTESKRRPRRRSARNYFS